MIPAAFDYVRADSADAAIAALAQYGDEAKLLAGGHSLLPLMKLRLATPAVLVDIARLRDLSFVRDAGDHVAIGALTRHREVERSALLAEEVPLLPRVAATVGDPQVRNRGTIGGSVAHADPASDLPAALLALRATLVAQGPDGVREIAAGDFFHGFLETSLADDELLTEIRVPKTGPVGAAYQKFTLRAMDWAIVGAAVTRLGDGSTGVALVNMGSVPVRATAVEAALTNGTPARQAAELAAEGTEPPSDATTSADYRRHLARVLVGRALDEAGLTG